MTARPHPEDVARLIREAAEAEILPRYKCLSSGDIHEKEPGQLVTEADVAAERMLARTLPGLFPGNVVGEESVFADPSLLGALDAPGAVWVIDPVDGTYNFAHGRSRFAVIVALVVDCRTVMGWIHDPLPDITVFAELGQGAWQESRRLAVDPSVPLARMRGAAPRRAALTARVAHVARTGSAAHDYLDLVRGQLDFAHYRKLMPWDHAAGVLIHAESSGHSALLDGQAYRPAALGGSQLLLAPDRDSWEELRGLVA